ncbi:bifunctional DNA primase/polymerase [Kitasatospora purpeofusca]|uniref:bifunctional DNA primase/polymerase n=1 Tax=Kitasatospora purpeofusca TaxID=67352 RepID=UPI00364D59BF
MTGNPLLTAALAAVERDWHVFPLLPGSKRPALHAATSCPRTGSCTAGHQGWEQRATLDSDTVRRTWSHRPYGIGLATGPSGLVVVDLDTYKPGATVPAEWAEAPWVTGGYDVLTALCERNEQPFPSDTYTVATPSGGLHLYFTAPAGLALRNTAGQHGSGLGWLIDTRAGGGYVVAAGSSVADRRYNVVLDTVPAPLPDWIASLLTPSPRPAAPVLRARRTTGTRPAYVESALHNETANVANAPEGTRNWALTRASRALGRFVANGKLGRTEVETALKGAAEQAGLTAREADATITNALNWSIANNPAGEAA